MGKVLDCQVIKESKLREYNEYIRGNDITLAIITVGDDYSCNVYVKNKIKVCNECGIKVSHVQLSDNENIFKCLLGTIDRLNNNSKINGILLQLTIKGLTLDEVNVCLDAIDINKDVDCLNSFNGMDLRVGGLLPCTVQGVLDILNYYKVGIEGKSVVVLGRSKLVGKPLSSVLDSLNATVTVLHSKTSEQDFKYYLKNADIVISAVGREKLFNSGNLAKHKNVYVIDVGINRTAKGIAGDFDVTNISDNIFYTSVPGGVGVLTVVNVVGNLVKLHKEIYLDNLVNDLVSIGIEPTDANINAYEGSLRGYNDDVSLYDDAYFNSLVNSIEGSL